MPLKKLTPAELSATPEYVQFLRDLRVGQGGKATTESEGVGKQTIKKKLREASDAADVALRFLRSDAETVVFEVTGKKRGRPKGS